LQFAPVGVGELAERLLISRTGAIECRLCHLLTGHRRKKKFIGQLSPSPLSERLANEISDDHLEEQ
jgi:hypothetical protein